MASEQCVRDRAGEHVRNIYSHAVGRWVGLSRCRTRLSPSEPWRDQCSRWAASVDRGSLEALQRHDVAAVLACGGVMAELTPGQQGAVGGGRWVELPPVGGPCRTSDRMTISWEWIASREPPSTSWSVIPYSAVSSVRREDYGRIVLSRPDGFAVKITMSALGSLEACELLAAVAPVRRSCWPGGPPVASRHWNTRRQPAR